jgi:N-acetylmuramoyl-L-alanine amidase
VRQWAEQNVTHSTNKPVFQIGQYCTASRRNPASVILLKVLVAWLLSLGLLTAQLAPVDVAIDPGHSRADVGASGGGMREYQLTFDLAQRVRVRLEQQTHLTVRMTREDDQPLTALHDPNATDDIAAEQAARIAAAGPASIFVSLHFNGGPATLRGTETYYNPNRAPDVSQDRALAQALQSHVIAALSDEVGYEAVDRGVKSDLSAGKPYGDFFSLRGPMPSALVENLFLSNPGDVAVLHDDATLDALADGCVQGILEYFSMTSTTAGG